MASIFPLLLFIALSAFPAFAFAFVPRDTIQLKTKKINNLKDKIFDAPMILKTSPTAFLGGGIFPFTAEYRLMLEMTTARNQSDQVGISLLGKSILWKLYEKAYNYTSTEVYKISGWRIQYAHKFYLLSRRGHAPSGFYFGPLISYANAHLAVGLSRHYAHTYYEFHDLNANLVFGVQAAHRNRTSFDLYFGLGYKNNTLYYHATTYRYAQIDSKDLGKVYNTHINAIFGINLGYAF